MSTKGCIFELLRPLLGWTPRYRSGPIIFFIFIFPLGVSQSGLLEMGLLKLSLTLQTGAHFENPFGYVSFRGALLGMWETTENHQFWDFHPSHEGSYAKGLAAAAGSATGGGGAGGGGPGAADQGVFEAERAWRRFGRVFKRRNPQMVGAL